MSTVSLPPGSDGNGISNAVEPVFQPPNPEDRRDSVFFRYPGSQGPGSNTECSFPIHIIEDQRRRFERFWPSCVQYPARTTAPQIEQIEEIDEITWDHL